ncbi:ATP-dependent RNA helicase RhlE [Haloferula luteola]|uniref:ATP-dependent RNA helicase RhlE n=1 Tax=Haloferula luteola TaxID=595692 RepID=A0A840VCQ9_9BACT|nr:DEAD/DEAH box helicase [Haloferula luteola]MBB5351690.1 ATP-dependent RNA helicase RhlE [Haloferula luteola]
MNPTSFEALPLAAPIQRALAERGYTTPSPIQAQSIPLLLQGRDLLGCAQTGTGKTAAFSLPILDALHRDPQGLRPKSARVLVLTPTRELASQVGKSLENYGTYLKSRHALVYGGVGQRPQVDAMRKGVDILVACPGRLLDLVQQGFIDLSRVEFFVLDEVDRMLDMGFQRDVQKIVSLLPAKRQSLFFSATLAPPIVKLAHEILQNPASVTIEPEVRTSDRVDQSVCFVARENKRALLLDQLSRQGKGELSIVFSRTKHGASKLARQITQAGFAAEAIHGNRTQSQRDRTLEKFRAGRLPVLVATDVAARGVDVRDVTLVVNFDLPNEPEAYVHRIGRTGRAGATGRAVSFCSEDEREYLRDIEKLIRQEVSVDAGHEWHLEDFSKLPVGRPAAKKSAKQGRPSRGGAPGDGAKPARSRRRRRRRPAKA